MRAGLILFTILFACALAPLALALPEGNVQSKVAFGMETLNTLCAGHEPDGKTVSVLDFGDAVISPNEKFSTKIACAAPLFADTSQFIQNGTTGLNITSKPHFIQFIEGKLQGQFKITVAPADVGGTQIDPEDIVKTNEDSSIVLKRNYREFYIVISLGDAETDEQSTHLVQRFIFELNQKGQPVVAIDHFTGVVDPNVLALSIGGEARNYQSGIMIVQSAKSTLDSCIFLSDARLAQQCVTSSLTQNQMRRLSLRVGPEYQPSMVTHFGWQHAEFPTNNPISWYANRVDFGRVLNELSLGSAALATQYKPNEALIKSWMDETANALSNPTQNAPEPTLTLN